MPHNKGLSFCIDYRKLNDITKRNSYLLPKMDKCADNLGDAKFFTRPDANNGFWQMAIDPIDYEKTAFITHDSLFEWRRVPSGLVNTPANFQRALDVIFAKYKRQTCLVYIDDVVIFSQNCWATYRACRRNTQDSRWCWCFLKFRYVSILFRQHSRKNKDWYHKGNIVK